MSQNGNKNVYIIGNKIKGVVINEKTNDSISYSVICNNPEQRYEIRFEGEVVKSETYITYYDIANTASCIAAGSNSTEYTLSSWIPGDFHLDGNRFEKPANNSWTLEERGRKIHLNNKFKITSGTGTIYNPYILEKER